MIKLLMPPIRIKEDIVLGLVASCGSDKQPSWQLGREVRKLNEWESTYYFEGYPRWQRYKTEFTELEPKDWADIAKITDKIDKALTYLKR